MGFVRKLRIILNSVSAYSFMPLLMSLAGELALPDFPYAG
jgi:hypothetical protein